MKDEELSIFTFCARDLSLLVGVSVSVEGRLNVSGTQLLPAQQIGSLAAGQRDADPDSDSDPHLHEWALRELGYCWDGWWLCLDAVGVWNDD